MRYNHFIQVLSVTALSVACAVADEIPPGVPNPLNPDGTYSDAVFFTTKAYERAALGLIVQEANRVAKELALPEPLPIVQSNLVKYYIAPFGYAYVNRSPGNVTTRNYSYGVTRGNKFGNLCITHLDERCIEYREKGQVPINEVDTNAAYRMATQWLAAVHVDVDSLGRCEIHVEPDEFWNHIQPGEKLKGKTFVPIYDVSWTSPKAKNFGVVASMQLFAPTKTLLQLSVYEADFILRQPLTVTNLAALLSATNAGTRQ